MAINVVSSREALSGSYKSRSAFPAGKYFLFKAMLRRKGGLTHVRLDGRAFAPSAESARGLITADLGQDFPPEDILVVIDEVPPLAMFVTHQRPADKNEWEEFKKNAGYGVLDPGRSIVFTGDRSDNRNTEVGFQTIGEPPLDLHSDPQPDENSYGRNLFKF